MSQIWVVKTVLVATDLFADFLQRFGWSFSCGQKNEDKLRLPKNCTDSTYGDTKKQYDPALSAKDPDQENNNEGARPVMQVWKLLQDPRGAEPPSVKSADIIIQVKLLC